MRRILATGLALSLSFATLATGQDVTRDLAYDDGARNVLDLYLPDTDQTPPVVLFIHGGRWMRGDKSEERNVSRFQALTDAGFAVAAMNHTYSTSAIWPAQKSDVHSAMAFLITNASDLGIDADRMAVWGRSSGAHLALWAGLLAPLEDGPKLRAVIAWFAPSDLAKLAPDRAEDDVPDAHEKHEKPYPESILLGVEVSTHKDAADAASPTARIKDLPASTELAPHFLAHGTDDTIVSPRQSERLYRALDARGTPVTFMPVPDEGHGGELFNDVVPRMITFLETHLKPASPR